MKKFEYQKGFTLIELLLAISAASILILTVGVILFMGFRSWRMNNAFANLRRDSAFAFSIMSRDIRESTFNALDDSKAGTLETTRKGDGTPVSFSLSGSSLVYNDGENDITLIPANVQDFTAEKQNDGVKLDLKMLNSEFGIGITNKVFINTRN